MNASDIEKIINQIDISLVYILLKLGLVYFILYSFKSIIENCVAYFMFKSDPLVSIGKKVKVNGFEGVITAITINYISVENNNEIYMVRMGSWKSSKWIFIKDKLEKE